MSFLLSRAFSCFLLAHHVENVLSFAYAPNFVTKIIHDQTGIKPNGLLSIDSEDPSAKEKNGQLESLHAIVRTRFPPEPNGYLHLGHAKAVSFNFEVARAFNGLCNMRLDDTNPSKEDSEYVESILEDVLWIQDGLFEGVPWDGKVRKTSDYFDEIYDCAVELIKSGDAYVDSLSAEEVREFRGSLTEPGKDSPFRSRSVAENRELFEGMKDGRFPEGAHVLRAKIDMSSPNINMRDPTLYRIKHEPHQETGDKWCIYPMYDFSHPIADAIEGITHSLCTLEFEDHRPFYDWTIEKLNRTGLFAYSPQQIEFSRLNIKSTVLSKRKLIRLVEEKHVNGWDDPRLPTLSGLRRRGVPPAALRLFCERVGISKAESNIDFSVLEDCIRETMDSSSPRAFCVLHPLKVTITNWNGRLEEFEVDRHPKVAEMGKRTIQFGKSVYIERSDFFDLDGPEGVSNGGNAPKGYKRLLPKGVVRLRYAYVIECTDVVRDPESGEPIELKCTYIPESRAGVTPAGMARVGGIIHWIEASTAVKCKVNQYDRLFTTEEPGRESGDFLQDINKDSLHVSDQVVVEPSVAVDALKVLAKCKASELERNSRKLYPSSLAFQFERNGYYCLDAASTVDGLELNRVVTLRDTWGSQQSESVTNSIKGDAKSDQRAEKIHREPLEDIRRVALRAATILSVEAHPEAESLLVCKVDCGDVSDTNEIAGPRIVVSKLAGRVSQYDLIGKRVVGKSHFVELAAVTDAPPSQRSSLYSNYQFKTGENARDREYRHAASGI
jgi:glutaminyl-tRNA synthetase